MCDWNVFEDSGSFIEMCSRIIGDSEKMGYLSRQRTDVIFPTKYEELCVFAQNVRSLSGI